MKANICISLFSLFCCVLNTKAQQSTDVSFQVVSSRATVGIKETFELKFVINNARFVDFETPYLHDFTVMQGPRTQSSIQITNGRQTSSYTYSYWVRPNNLGIFEIPSMEVETSAGTLISLPLSIRVVEKVNRPNMPPSLSSPFDEENTPDLFKEKDPFDDDFFEDSRADDFFNSRRLHTPKQLDELLKRYKEFFNFDFDQMTPPKSKGKKEKKEKTYKL